MTDEYQIVKSTDLNKELRAHRAPMIQLRTQIDALDDLLEGFELGETTAITGPTKGGKTLLCQTFTKAFVEKGHDCLWVPYEVGGLRFFRGFGDELPEFYLPRRLKRNALDWLEGRIEAAQDEFGIRAVFVDHLHFLVDMMQMRNPSLEIGSIMRRLVGMAQERNVCLFIIAHMMKVAFNKEPEAGDIRDSSFVEQEADNTIAVWRGKKEGSDKTRIKIIHNRRNGIFDKTIHLRKEGPYLVMDDCAASSDQPEPEQPKEPIKELWGEQ